MNTKKLFHEFNTNLIDYSDLPRVTFQVCAYINAFRILFYFTTGDFTVQITLYNELLKKISCCNNVLYLP